MLRRITKLLCCIVVLMQLFACSPSSKDTSSGSWQGGPKLKHVTLTIYLPSDVKRYPVSYEYQLKKVIMKELEKSALSMLNVHLQIGNLKRVKLPDEEEFAIVDKDIATAVKSGLPCDLFFSPVTTLSIMDEKSYAKDISSLFPRYAPEYFNLFKPEELDAVTYKGKLLGIPSRTLPGTRRLCAVVRDDLAENYLKTYIKSYNEFELFLKSVKQNEPKYTPVLFSDSIGRLFAEIYGYEVFNPVPTYSDMGLVYKKDDPGCKLLLWDQTSEFQEAINRLRKWKNAGYYEEYGNVTDYDALTGKYASFIMEYGSAERLNKVLEAGGIKGWKYKEYELFSGVKSQRTYTPGNVAFINSESKNPERAVMLIEWLMSNQNAYNIFKFGIEGKNYKVKKDGSITPIVAEGSPKEEAYVNWQSLWCVNNIYRDHLQKGYLDSRLKYIDLNTKYNAVSSYKTDYKSWNDFINNAGGNVHQEEIERYLINSTYSDTDIIYYINELRDPTKKVIEKVQPLVDDWISQSYSNKEKK